MNTIHSYKPLPILPYVSFRNYIKEDLNAHIFDCYGKIISISPTEQEKYTLKISLVTKRMFNVDYQFLSHFDNINLPDYDELDEYSDYDNYHPFFYEFVAEIAYHQMVSISNLGDRWQCVTISDVSYQTDDPAIIGTELFSASPLISSGKKLIFNHHSGFDPFCTLLDKTYTKENLRVITQNNYNNSHLKYFRSLFTNEIKNVTGIIYSVGLANNSKLTFDDRYGNSFSILYDLGKTHISQVLERPEVDKTIKEFKKSRFNAIVLSHWDSDHIIAVGDYTPSSLYSHNKTWIAPDINMLAFNELSLGAIRLACYISKKCNTYFFRNPNKSINIDNPYYRFSIWQGQSTPKKSASHQNNIGLLLNICGYGDYHIEYGINKYSVIKSGFHDYPPDKINLLLCGDCVYDNWPDIILDDEHNILCVPHHGTNKALPSAIKKTENGVAIICSDKSGYSESFPGKEHVFQLIEKGYSHILTTEQSGNIRFNIVFH